MKLNTFTCFATTHDRLRKNFSGQGNGMWAADTGRLVNSSQGILAESGQHPFLDYFAFGDTAAVQPLCDALQ